MYKKITSENVTMFAIRHYDNPHCESEKEFYDDMKRFKYIKRLLRKHKETNILKERLILLLFKIQREYLSTLKSFLLYLNMIREDELNEIEKNTEVFKILREL